MSGGHFDNSDYVLYDMARQMEDDLNNEEYNDMFEDKQTRKMIRHLIKMTEKTAKLIHAYDYFMSGDISEEKFLKECIENGLREEKKNE